MTGSCSPRNSTIGNHESSKKVSLVVWVRLLCTLITDSLTILDSVTKEKRSEIMSKVRSKNTSPELAVRKLLFSLGYRYRLHAKNLPGKPDLVFPGRKKVIFVHGCFWHYHDCKTGHIPKSRLDYWKPKLTTRRQRDATNVAALIGMGWRVLVLWECEISDLKRVEILVREFLD